MLAKALTREDLLYILQSIFKISEQESNAFQMLTDGLYVEDYQVHAIDTNLHINETLKQILDRFRVSEAGILLYDETPINIAISSKEGNGITVEEDGLYTPNIKDVTEHVNNNDIHVTIQKKEEWDGTLEKAKKFTLDEIGKLVIYDIQIVPYLPEIPVIEENTYLDDVEGEDPEIPEPIWPSSTTLYLLANDPDCPEECLYTMYMFLHDEWVKLSITNKTLNKYALKLDVQDAVDNAHSHNNKDTLDKFGSDANGRLLYNGADIHAINVSTKENNAMKVVDGGLYVEDLKEELKSVEVSAAFAKVNLYNEEIKNSGVYELKDYIDNYNLILVEYYYRPNNENEQPGCAKTAVIDTDVLEYLYNKNMDYMLEYGYGILMSNSKIRMHEDKLWVDYYHNVCIYRITGIRRGDDNE